MRQTSLEAYHNLQNGGLSKARWTVYDIVFQHGPISMNKVESMFERGRRSTISGRFSELEKMGLIYDTGERSLTESGNSCIVWDVTSRVQPLPLPTKEQKAEKILERAVRSAASLLLCKSVDERNAFIQRVVNRHALNYV